MPLAPISIAMLLLAALPLRLRLALEPMLLQASLPPPSIAVRRRLGLWGAAGTECARSYGSSTNSRATAKAKYPRIIALFDTKAHTSGRAVRISSETAVSRGRRMDNASGIGRWRLCCCCCCCSAVVSPLFLAAMLTGAFEKLAHFGT